MEHVVQPAGELPGQRARAAHALPEPVERDALEAGGQHLEVEVEAQPAAGQRVEQRAAGDRRAPELEERARRLRASSETSPMSSAQSPVPSISALARQALDRGLLEVVDHALAPLVEAEDAVARALLGRGRLGEAEHGRALVGDARAVEVDHDVARGHDDLAAPPRVAEEQRELRVEHDRGQQGARGDRQGREELALGRVARQPAALAARVDQQHALAGEERVRVVPARAQQRVQGPQRAAAGAHAASPGVGHHLEAQLARVEAVLQPAVDQRPEGPGLRLGRGGDEDGVEQSHGGGRRILSHRGAAPPGCYRRDSVSFFSQLTCCQPPRISVLLQ